MTVQQRLDSSWRVDVGRVRQNNEDAVSGHEPADPAVRAERGCLYVVADGMGGHAAGEVASNYAVQSIVYYYYSLPWAGVAGTLITAIRRANEEIHEESGRNAERRGMGSTVVTAAVLEDQAVIAHVGDSRAYLIRNGQPVLLTRDHTWVGERLAEGTLTPAEAEHHPNRNVLTRNLGSRAEVEPEVNVQQLQRGDRLLLCSDGLWGAVPDTQIAALAGNGTTEAAVSALVSASNAAGGHDNIGVALVRVGSGSGATTRVLTAPGRPTWGEAERATRRLPVGGGSVLGRLGRNKPLLAAVAFAIVGLLLTGGTVLLASGGRGPTPTPPAGPLATNAAGAPIPGSPARANGSRTPSVTANRTATSTGPAQYVVQAADKGGISAVWNKCAADGVSLDDYKVALVILNPVLEGSGDAIIQPGQVLQLPPAQTRPGPLCNGSATPIPTPSPTPPPTATPAQPTRTPITQQTTTPVRTPVAPAGGGGGQTATQATHTATPGASPTVGIGAGVTVHPSASATATGTATAATPSPTVVSTATPSVTPTVATTPAASASPVPSAAPSTSPSPTPPPRPATQPPTDDLQPSQSPPRQDTTARRRQTKRR